MANPARAKGSGFEVELLPTVRDIYGPQVERSPLKGTADMGDFVGIPPGLVLEAKKTDVPHFLQWGKTCNKKSDNWRVIWSGDRRKGDGPFVLMPIRNWVELEWKAQRYDEANGLVVSD